MVSVRKPARALRPRGRPRVGIGVVLLGLTDVFDRLRVDPEWGHRWRKAYPIEGLAPSVLAKVYQRLLPACDREARDRGSDAWVAFIKADVARHIRGSVRRVTSHVWEYVALCEDECEPVPATVAEVPFDEERFLAALYGSPGPRDAGDAGEDDA
jgi:hypothetical protein